jgi:hypothetical protein
LTIVSPDNNPAPETDRIDKSSQAEDVAQVWSQAASVEENPGSQVATTRDSTRVVRDPSYDEVAPCDEAIVPALPESGASENVSEDCAEEPPAASEAVDNSASPSAIEAVCGELTQLTALAASAGLESLDRAVAELVDELNDLGEQFAELLTARGASPITAVAAGAAFAGVFELRLRRKRPTRTRHGDWIWLFSDLVGDAPGEEP